VDLPSLKRGDGNWKEFCRIRDQVVTREEFLEKQLKSSKFDSGGSIKKLWRNLKNEGFAFKCVEEVEVSAAIMSIGSGALTLSLGILIYRSEYV
jgi:hypothetical protein